MHLTNQALYHHGIKGQKWGRRRYQYDDGSLTPKGRIRYGVNNGGYTISKGSEFNRITGSKRDKKTLFVSTNEKDFLGYRAKAKNLPSTMKSDKAYIKTYTAKKDLKVASGSDVANYIIEKIRKY